MSLYAWSIKVPEYPDIARVTAWSMLDDYMRLLGLPGYEPGQFTSLDRHQSDQGSFTFQEDDIVRWTITWNKVTK